MSPPQMPFFMDGPTNDQGYMNTRDLPIASEAKRFVEGLWCRYHHLADTHFREDARNHFSQRFWEMYLGVTLLEHGFPLETQRDEGPEFYAHIGKSCIWFEAIAPGPGEGPDQVPPLPRKEISEKPTEKILLRITNALAEKQKKYTKALDKGIISPEDHYVLAINTWNIQNVRDNKLVRDIHQALYGIGPYTMGFDPKTGEVEDSGYQYRPIVLKQSGSPVSTRDFLGQDRSFCSAVLHSSVDYAKHHKNLGDDFLVLHNLYAKCPLGYAVFKWCDQYPPKPGVPPEWKIQP